MQCRHVGTLRNRPDFSRFYWGRNVSITLGTQFGLHFSDVQGAIAAVRFPRSRGRGPMELDSDTRTVLSVMIIAESPKSRLQSRLVARHNLVDTV